MKSFNGELLFLDRSDINTDEIIPARYLTEISKQALAPHLLEDLSLTGFDPTTDIAGKHAVLTRSNFGCGSSREHAPWALEANGIHVVIAESFARIFRQNMFNCGMLAIELAGEVIEGLFRRHATSPTRLEVDLDAGRLVLHSGGDAQIVGFTLSDFDRALVRAGGWVEYADSRY